MTFKLVRQKAVYLLAAAALVLTLLGTPMVTPPIHAGDCPTVTGNNC